MEGTQGSNKEHISAANKVKVDSRHFYNSKLSHIQNCKVHHNLTSTRFSSNVSKNTDPRITSSSPIVVHSRTFVNSRIVQKIKSKVVRGHKNVIKCVDNSKACLTVVNRNDSSISLSNRFQVFSDLSESEIDNKIMEKCKSSIKVNKDKSHKRVNLQNCVLGSHSQNHINQQNQSRGSQQNNECHNLVTGSIVNITDVVKTVMNGNNCIKKVNVLTRKNKCSDLSKCIAQQDTVLGFLPISNLKRTRINNALKPNCVLNTNTFDPIKTHQVVEATGKYNFEEARIQLPSKINFEYLETLALNYWDYQLPLFLKYGF